jgi:hypothetical protein
VIDVSEAIIVALITAAVSLLGIYAGLKQTQNKIQEDLKDSMQNLRADMEKNQAVVDVKIDELTREVREHNNYAKRVPVLESKVEALERANQK